MYLPCHKSMQDNSLFAMQHLLGYDNFSTEMHVTHVGLQETKGTE